MSAAGKIVPVIRRTEETTFWGRLKAGAKAHGYSLTQDGVAKSYGISQPSVSLWNKPDKFPEMELGVRIAKDFGLAIHWLYTGVGQQNVMPTDSDAQELCAAWHRLSPPLRAKLLAYSQGLLSIDEEGGAGEPPFRRRPSQ